MKSSASLFGLALQLVEHSVIDVARCGGEAVVGQVGDADEANVTVLAVESATGQRLVDILEPVRADEIGVVGDGAQIA